MATNLDSVRAACAEVGIDGLLISPSTDLRYLTGYNAHPLTSRELAILEA